MGIDTMIGPSSMSNSQIVPVKKVNWPIFKNDDEIIEFMSFISTPDRIEYLSTFPMRERARLSIMYHESIKCYECFQEKYRKTEIKISDLVRSFFEIVVHTSGSVVAVCFLKQAYDIWTNKNFHPKVKILMVIAWIFKSFSIMGLTVYLSCKPSETEETRIRREISQRKHDEKHKEMDRKERETVNRFLNKNNPGGSNVSDNSNHTG